MPISILIVDDHKLFRESLQILFETIPDFCIVGEAKNGMECLALVEKLHPDVVVMDFMMPDINGVDATFCLRKQQPDTHVVILSMYCDLLYVSSAMQNGASGYILKEDSIDNLILAVTAAAGKFYFSPSIRESVSRLALVNVAAIKEEFTQVNLCGREMIAQPF
jgi:DNA-binding NarL/FixJ family response regulator